MPKAKFSLKFAVFFDFYRLALKAYLHQRLSERLKMSKAILNIFDCDFYSHNDKSWSQVSNYPFCLKICMKWKKHELGG